MFYSSMRRGVEPRGALFRGARAFARSFLSKAAAGLATLSLLLPGVGPAFAADTAEEFGPLKKISAATKTTLGFEGKLLHVTFDNAGNAYVIGTNASNKTRKIVKVDPLTGSKQGEVELPSNATARAEIGDIVFVPKFKTGGNNSEELENIILVGLEPANNMNGMGYVKLNESGFDPAGLRLLDADRNGWGRTFAKYYGESMSYDNPQPAMVVLSLGGPRQNTRLSAYLATRGLQRDTTFWANRRLAHPYGDGLAILGYESSNTLGAIYKWKPENSNYEVPADKVTFTDTWSYARDSKRHQGFVSANGSMQYGLYGVRNNGFGLVNPKTGMVHHITGSDFAGSNQGKLSSFALLPPGPDGKYTALAGVVSTSEGAFVHWKDFQSLSTNFVEGSADLADDPLGSEGWSSQKIADAGRDIMEIKVAQNGMVSVVKDDEIVFYDVKADDQQVRDVQVVRKADGTVRPVAPNARGRFTFSAGSDKPDTLTISRDTGEITGTLPDEAKGSFKVTAVSAVTGGPTFTVDYKYGKFTEGEDPSSTSVTFRQVNEQETTFDEVEKLWANQFPKPYVDVSFAAGDTNTVPAALNFEPGSGRLSGVLGDTDPTPLVLLADNVLKKTVQTVTVSFTKIRQLHFKEEGGSEYISTPFTESAFSGYSGFTYAKDVNPLATMRGGEWIEPKYTLSWTMASNGGIEGLENDGPVLIGTANAAPGDYTVTLHGLISGMERVRDGKTYYEPFVLHYPITISEAAISPYKADLTAGATVSSVAASPVVEGAAYAVTSTDAAEPGAGLPKGLTLAADGVLDGTIAADVAVGLYTPTLSLVKQANTVTGVYTLLVRKEITLDAKSFGAVPGGAALAGVTPGVAGGPVASYEILATAAKEPAAADAETAAYPSGLAFNTADGVLSGQVAADVSEGAYTFAVKAIGSSVQEPAGVYTATALYTVTVAKALKVTDAAYTLGVGQQVTLTPTYEGSATAWAAAATDAVAAGAGLPKGLTVNEADGTIVGAVAPEAATGVYTAVLTAKGQTYDAAGTLADASALGTVLLTVSASPTVSAVTSTVVAGAQVTVTPAPVAEAGWSYAAVGLPEGWSINTDSGVVNGAVDADTEFTVQVTATALTEGDLLSAEAVYVFKTVAKVAFEDDDAALLVTVGEAANLVLNYEGAPTTIVFEGAVKGTEPGNNVYPDGVQVNNEGVLSGVVAAAVKPGEYVFTVRAAGAPEGNADTMVITINVETTEPTTDPAVDPATDPAAGNDSAANNGDPAANGGDSAGNDSAGNDSAGDDSANGGDSAGDDSASSNGDSANNAGDGNSGNSGDSGDPAGEPTTDPVAPGAEASIPAPADLPEGAKEFAAENPAGTEPAAGVMPSGLTVDPADGSVKGLVADNVKPGKYTFPVVYKDADGKLKTTSYTVTVDPKPSSVATVGGDASIPAPADAPAGASSFGFGPGVSYATTPGSGGVPAVLFLAEDGSLSGKIGENVQPGEYTFPVTYTDANGKVQTTNLTVTVAPKGAGADKGGAASVPAPADVPAGASGFGFGPGVSYATTPGSGALPALLFLGKDGSLSGKIGENVQPGEYTFPVTYTDANGKVQTTNLTVTVAPKGAGDSANGDSAGSAGGSVGDKGGDSAPVVTVAEPVKAVITQNQATNVAGIAGAVSYSFAPGAAYATAPGANAVPSVLFLNADNGSLQGIVKGATGVYTFGIDMTKADGSINRVTYLITVVPSVSAAQTVEVVVTQSQVTSIAGANVPDAVSYSFAPGEAYGAEPAAGAVPSLLFLNTDNGSLQGIVKGAIGVYTFGIDVTKADRSIIRVTYRITVVASPRS